MHENADTSIVQCNRYISSSLEIEFQLLQCGLNTALASLGIVSHLGFTLQVVSRQECHDLSI